MNTLSTIIGTALVLGSSVLSANTHAADFVAADNTFGTQACMAIASNKPIEVAQTLRSLRMSKRVVEDKLECNNMSTAKFASLYGFDRSATYLNLDTTTQTSIHDLAKVTQDTVLVVSGSK